jgi:hypothetical protein
MEVWYDIERWRRYIAIKWSEVEWSGLLIQVPRLNPWDERV